MSEDTLTASQSSGVRQAPYGRVCMSCSRAKCKCIYVDDETTCDRCRRLHRECHLPTRKRNLKTVGRSRTGQLEEKLEDLVSLLRSQATSKPTQSSSDASKNASYVGNFGNVPSPNILSAARDIPSSMNTNNVPDSIAISQLMPAITASRSTSAICAASHAPPADSILPQVADECLEAFRTYMLNFFPFIYIPLSTTADDLRHKQPFLWLCIMSITAKSISQQFAIAGQIRQIVCERVVNQNERSLDLLLGFICYIGWSHYYHKKHGQYLSMWTNIATALVFDLGLNKPAPSQPGTSDPSSIWGQAKPKSTVSSGRTMEERRATLSLFVITSTVSTVQKKIDTLQWTPHMEDSLRILTEQHEYIGDLILAAQVKFHLLMEQISHCPWTFEGTRIEEPKSPPASYVKALQSQLQEIKRSLSSELIQNATVQLFLHHTQLAIHEGAIDEAAKTPGTIDLNVVNDLVICLKSIEAWFNVFFLMPSTMNLGVTFAIYNQLSRCLISLFRLTTLDSISWDKDNVRRTVDVFTVLDRFANSMEQVPSLAGLSIDGSDESVFSNSAKIVRALKVNWEVEAANHLSITLVQEQHMREAVPDDMTMNLFNDQWLPDIFASWDS